MKRKLPQIKRTELAIVLSILLALVAGGIIVFNRFTGKSTQYIDQATRSQMIDLLAKTSRPFSDHLANAIRDLELTDSYLEEQCGRRSFRMSDIRPFLQYLADSHQAENVLLLNESCQYTSIHDESGILDVTSDVITLFGDRKPIVRYINWRSGLSRYLVAIPVNGFTVDGLEYGAVALVFNPDIFNSIFRTNIYSGHGRYYVLDNTGLVIFTNESDTDGSINLISSARTRGIITPEQAESIKKDLSEDRNNCLVFNVDGNEYFFGYYNDKETEYNYCIAVPGYAARDALTNLRSSVIEGTVMVTVVLFLVVLILVVSVLSSLHNRTIADKEKKVSQAKSEFLNNMSHDIRTPMNAIVGYTELAMTHIDNKDRLTDYLGKIKRSSAYLLSLINDILEMSRIESGKIVMEENPNSILQTISEVENILSPDIEKRNHTLVTDCSGLIHENAIFDKLRLKQILINLMSNAVKYTPDCGKIELVVFEESLQISDRARYVFIVRDNGIGMSRDFAKTLFDPFTRERSSTISGIQGTGLGMSITKSLTDMMHGDISLHTEKGKGTEFTLTLDFDYLFSTTQETQDCSYEENFSGRKILLVEDNELNSEIATTILEEAGFTVSHAEDGDIAVSMIKEAGSGDYDLILMDIQMPNMDGYEATRQIRALGTSISWIPIIAMTANAFEEDRKCAIEAGMNDHIAKPINVDLLKKTIARYL